MKLAVGALCLLGIMAAACAAFLVNGLNATTQVRTPPTTAEANPTVNVLFVARAVPAMTVVDGGLVVSKTILQSSAPAGYLTSVTDVVGKVLAKPLAEGEPFTKGCFAEMTGGKQLAGVIPKGKRAVGISVTDYSALDGLIVPGSMVDVMVSFRDDGSAENHRDAVTTTLVENVQVLAFEQQSVVSAQRSLTDIDPAHTGSTRRVTLLVDTKQSKALELAMQQGTLSLALRNPLDAGDADKESVSVRSLMGDVQPIKSPLPPPDAKPDAVVAPPPPAHPHWDTTVIRGDQVETQSFPLPTPAKKKSDANKDASGSLSDGSVKSEIKTGIEIK